MANQRADLAKVSNWVLEDISAAAMRGDCALADEYGILGDDETWGRTALVILGDSFVMLPSQLGPPRKVVLCTHGVHFPLHAQHLTL